MDAQPPKSKKPVRHTKKSDSNRQTDGDQTGVQGLESSKRLVPYSLYLSEDTYNRLKSKAKNRQASSMVRDAINMLLDGDEQYTAGYKQAMKNVMRVIESNKLLNAIGYDGETLAKNIYKELSIIAENK